MTIELWAGGLLFANAVWWLVVNAKPVWFAFLTRLFGVANIVVGILLLVRRP